MNAPNASAKVRPGTTRGSSWVAGLLAVVATACASGASPAATSSPAAPSAPAPAAAPSSSTAQPSPPASPPSTLPTTSPTTSPSPPSSLAAASPTTTVGKATAQSPTTTASTTTTAPAPTRVGADETEYHISLSSSQFSAGSYVITAVNKGQATHNLVITGPGIAGQQTPFLAPGQSANLQVNLQPGSYELYCGVGTHRQLGMDVHITVT